MTILATALTVIAIVTRDRSVLRTAPPEPAARHAVFWQGNSLEIRESKGDRLPVHDHRRERPGYLRVSQVRQLALKPENASELLAVVRFLRDTPGAEALGISYAAAYLKGAPAEAIDGRGFDALGTFAERLARARKPLLTRCTYGIVWTVEVVPPATDYPNLGYVEFAGWVPGGAQMLTAGEAKVEGCYKQSSRANQPLQPRGRALGRQARFADCFFPLAESDLEGTDGEPSLNPRKLSDSPRR